MTAVDALDQALALIMKDQSTFLKAEATLKDNGDLSSAIAAKGCATGLGVAYAQLSQFRDRLLAEEA